MKHTWTERYFVRTATLHNALPLARARALEDHPDTPRDAMMTPTASARTMLGKVDIVYGYDVTVIGKPS